MNPELDFAFGAEAQNDWGDCAVEHGRFSDKIGFFRGVSGRLASLIDLRVESGIDFRCGEGRFCRDSSALGVLGNEKARLTVRSTAYTESHFDAKASRYQAALDACPLARTFEILPLLLLLDHHNASTASGPRTLADLLCGSGYLTSQLESSFETVVGIDVSARMLDFYPVGGKVRAVKAAIDAHPEVLQGLRPDVITCLAGVHHVYEQRDGTVDDEASDAIQADLLVEWARALAPGGCMVVADVSDPREKISFSMDDSRLANHDEQFSGRFENTRRAFGQYLGHTEGVPPRRPDSVRQHVEDVLVLAPECKRAQPALWFREVVAEHGMYGHTDHFLRWKEIRAQLTSEGFSSQYHELPTPWAFPSEADFLYFFHEKFALGPPARRVEDISAAARDLITRQVDRLLGLSVDAHGHVFAGWRLGYLVVRPDA